MRKSKTAAERGRDREQDEEAYWVKFKARVESANTIPEIRAIANDTPPPDATGRGFHTNLMHFLATFARPGSSRADERVLYVRLIRRLDAAGELKPTVRERVEADLGSVPE